MLALKIKLLFMFLATILHIVIGILVYQKNRKSKVNITFTIFAFTRAAYIFFHGWEYLYILFHYISPEQVPYFGSNVFFPRMTYIGVVGLSSWVVLLLHLKAISPGRLRLYSWLLYAPAVGMMLLGFFSPAVLKGTIFIYPNKIGIRGSLKFLEIVYLLTIFTLGFVNLMQLYSKNRSGSKRLQIKYLTIGMVIESLGDIAVFGILPMFGNYKYTEVAPFFLSIFTIGFTAYAIIRHRFLEIETVIHKTLLWMLASGLLFIPMIMMFSVLHPWLSQMSVISFSLLIAAIVYSSAFYYLRIQPLINHWFRRKEYDYQQILLNIGEKLTREIDIDVVTNTLLLEITGSMYVRNGVIYLETSEKDGCRWQAAVGYDADITPAEENIKNIDIMRDYGKVMEYLRQKREALEQQQFSFDPHFEEIKDEGEKLCKLLAVEIIVPLVIENQLIGILGLGKKETLNAYTLKDVEILEKLGRVAGVPLYNALHHQEIMEKERLAEALRLRRRKQIERKILSYQEQLRKLMNELLITEQRERARLALALHDNITQNLAVSRLKLAELLALPKSAEIDNRLRLISGVLEETLQYVRSYTFELSPPILHEIGLEAALDTLFEKMQEKYQIAITMKANQTPRQLEPQLGILLYESVRELLMNVVKHAQASEVTVEIGEEKNHLSISVNDNGKGFTIAEASPFYYRAGHLGLFSVRERLMYVGGNIRINSKIGEGTTVLVTAPLKLERGQA